MLKLTHSGPTLRKTAEDRADNVRQIIIARGKKAADLGRLSLSIDHTTLPNFQQNEKFTSNIAVNLTISGKVRFIAKIRTLINKHKIFITI